MLQALNAFYTKYACEPDQQYLDRFGGMIASVEAFVRPNLDQLVAISLEHGFAWECTIMSSKELMWHATFLRGRQELEEEFGEDDDEVAWIEQVCEFRLDEGETPSWEGDGDDDYDYCAPDYVALCDIFGEIVDELKTVV